MFVDRVRIHVTAGAGGDGSPSMRREAHVPRGGPDGGDGGRGGSVILEAQAGLTTLAAFRRSPHLRATSGGRGARRRAHGANGTDVVMAVPPGTVVRRHPEGELLGEVLAPGDRLVVARGGRGGRGNVHFVSPTHQAPRHYERGDPGEEGWIELELKLIADVGLVGEPNAGKSTLLSVISAARPRIADYPFTTLEPNLGVARLADDRTFVVADIPGIIEGAHLGKGLGLTFLRHVERTRVLAFLIPLEAPDPQAVYDRLRGEVERYSAALHRKPHLVVLTKQDLWPPDASLPRLHAPDAEGTLAISAVTGAGVPALVQRLADLVSEARVEARALTEPGHER
jgi:GTP-binding protein